MSLWICDVNGVLVASIGIIRQAFQATAARCGFGFGAADFEAVKGLSLLEAYRILDPDGDPSTRQQLHRQYVRGRIAEVHAYPDVRATLEAAKAAGVSVAAVTSHGETAEACLVSAGLYSLLDCLVTQEEVKRPKPHPDTLLMVLDLLGTGITDRFEEVLYVGDTAMDVEAGKAAGVRTVGVTYGASREAEIRAARPAHVIGSFADMRSFLVEADRPAAPGGLTHGTRWSSLHVEG